MFTPQQRYDMSKLMCKSINNNNKLKLITMIGLILENINNITTHLMY